MENKKKDELQNRREFFKKAAKGALPILGAIVLANVPGILKAADAHGTGCVRNFYEYPAVPGLGHFIHTYVCNGTPVIPSFMGEPERVSIGNDINMFADILWDQLNDENKISLFVRYTNLATGEYEQRIFNKNE